MGPSSPLVKISGQYAQSIRDTSVGRNGNDSRRVDPTNRNYDITFGDSNMAKELVRHGPDALYAHIMRAAFDPVYGRVMSIAREEEVKPAVRFPLAEETRQHERSEMNNSPAKVYNITEHPSFNPKNKQPGEKGKDDKPYQPYKTTYGKGYGASNVVVIYGQKTKSQKEKSLYSAGRDIQKSQGKNDYKVDFAATNDNKKAESLYQTSVRVLSEIYTSISNKVGKYLVSRSYAEKSSKGGNRNVYEVVTKFYPSAVEYSTPPILRKPANDDYELEQKAKDKVVSGQGGLEKLVA